VGGRLKKWGVIFLSIRLGVEVISNIIKNNWNIIEVGLGHIKHNKKCQKRNITGD